MEKTDSAETETTSEDVAPAIHLTKAFSFPTLQAATVLSQLIAPHFCGASTLYKDEGDARYYLVLHISDHTPEEFNRICNVISEYGTSVSATPASLSYYAEHFKTILEHDAVQTLNAL